MLRVLPAILASLLILAGAGLPRDGAIRERMVAVRMADGHTLFVAPVEVTDAEWARCVADRYCSPAQRLRRTQENFPATGINWLDAQDYLAWANARSGGGLRLPTSAEWRWLNRSLEKPKPAPAFTDPRLSWAAGYGQEETPGGPVQPSGSFSKTPDGISDLDGNVWEWTASCASGGYAVLDSKDCPAFIAEGAHEAQMPLLVRNPALGGCATGIPPTHLGLRLVADR